MDRVIGVMTEDFRLFHDLVAELKAQQVPFQILAFGQPIPSRVGVVLTSPAEAGRIAFPQVVPAVDVRTGVARARHVLKGRTTWKELVIGIDPGAMPGVAVVGDGDVIETRQAPSPEAVARLVSSLLGAYPAEGVRLRVGHQDPTNRNRILNVLLRAGYAVEIVNEAGTTPRSHHPDLDAAINIASTPGAPAGGRYAVVPTSGEVRDVQRRSRIASNGTLTISAALARQVAQGRLSLEEAIERQRLRRGPTAGPQRSRRRSNP